MAITFEEQCPYCGYIRRIGFKEPAYYPGVESDACQCWPEDPDELIREWDCT